MRPILILAAIVTQLLLPGSSAADDYDDCKAQCRFARDTRNMDCPSPYDSSSATVSREQCLKNSQDAYNACVKSCPAPSTPPPPPPPAPTPRSEPAPSGNY